MIWMLVHLKLSQRLLTLSSFFLFFFSTRCSDWVFFASLHSKSLIWFSASSTLLLFPCKLFFILNTISFISDWIYFMMLRPSLSSLSILITSVLNSLSERLLISILLSSFSGVLGHVSLSPHFGSLSAFVSMYLVGLLWLPVLVVWPNVVGVL